MFIRLSNCLTKGFLYYCIGVALAANIKTLGEIEIFSDLFLKLIIPCPG